MIVPASPPPTAPREVELKLFVPPSAVASLWTHPLIVAHAIGPLRVARLENRYFDTIDRELMQRWMALRLRRIGRRWLQTLKASGRDEGALSARDEWEMPVAGPRLELGLLHDTPLAALPDPGSLAARLVPVFTTNFRRESRQLRLANDAEVEFAVDVGVIAAGRGRERRILPISEVEIEWKGGASDDDAASLLLFAARLARDIALIPLAASKAARGYRLADRTSLRAASVPLPAASLADGPRAHLARIVDNGNAALLVDAHALLEIAAAGELQVDTSASFVHHARVVVRRMRSTLRLFRPVAGGKRIDVLEERLRATAQVFGEVRDRDIFAAIASKRLAPVVADDDAGREALAAMLAEVARQRGASFDALTLHLVDPVFGATALAIERTVLGLASGPERKRAATLAVVAPAWLGAQRDRIVRRARRIAALDETQRHGLRIEVKRLRHGLDLFAGLYDETAIREMRDALIELQDRLGRLNDLSVAGALMRGMPDAPSSRLVCSRFDAWFAGHVRRQLPKVASLAVAFELIPVPWAWLPAPARRAVDPLPSRG